MIPPLFVDHIAIPAACASSGDTFVPGVDRLPALRPSTACVLFPESLDSPFPLPCEQFLVSWGHALGLMKEHGKINPIVLVFQPSVRCYCVMVETDLLGEIVPVVKVYLPVCTPEQKDLLSRLLWSSTVFNFIDNQLTSPAPHQPESSTSLQPPPQHQPSILTLPKTPRRPAAPSHPHGNAPTKAAASRPPPVGPRPSTMTASIGVDLFRGSLVEEGGMASDKRVLDDVQLNARLKEGEIGEHGRHLQKRPRIDNDYPPDHVIRNSRHELAHSPLYPSSDLPRGPEPSLQPQYPLDRNVPPKHHVTFLPQSRSLYAPSDIGGQGSTSFPSEPGAHHASHPTAEARNRTRSGSLAQPDHHAPYLTVDAPNQTRLGTLGVTSPPDERWRKDVRGGVMVGRPGNAGRKEREYATRAKHGGAARMNSPNDIRDYDDDNDDDDDDEHSGSGDPDVHRDLRPGTFHRALSPPHVNPAQGGRNVTLARQLARNPNARYGSPANDTNGQPANTNGVQRRHRTAPPASTERGSVDDDNDMHNSDDGEVNSGSDGGNPLDFGDHMGGDEEPTEDTQDQRRFRKDFNTETPRGRGASRAAIAGDEISRPIPKRPLRSRIDNSSLQVGNGNGHRVTRETARRLTRQQSEAVTDGGLGIGGADDEEDTEDTDNQPHGTRWYTQPRGKNCTNCVKLRIPCKTKQMLGSSICAACSAGKKRNCTFRTSSLADKTEIIHRNSTYPQEALDMLLDGFAYVVKQYNSGKDRDHMDTAAEDYAREVRQVIHRLAAYQDEFFEHVAPQLTSGEKSLDLDLEEPILERYDLG